MFPRSAGVLLHPTSLPSRFGIGDLGEAAYHFIDFLAGAKQTLWQILPLGPTGYGDSPYQSFSSFAGNPMLISPERLLHDGYLPAEAIQNIPDFPAYKVDYGWVIGYKTDLLRQSYEHFKQHGNETQQAHFDIFCTQQQHWLDDFAFFMALKDHHVEHEGGVWNKWPREIALREPAAMAHWREKLADDIRRYQFWQFLFHYQWLDLKRYANERHVRIVGDIPIFVAFDSSDVWANRELYHLDEETGAPTVIAGVPPDYFSETGQRWGNPLYHWEKMAARQYEWWTERIKNTLALVDIVRIDHFRGFQAYWEIPATEPTAINGRWVEAPGMELFSTLKKRLGNLPIIAEDLGIITPEVEALRDAFGLPGMKILQFAFGGAQENAFLPHNYVPNCVVYTGSHDNDTTLGWYQTAYPHEQDAVRRYLARDDQDIVWHLIRLAYRSVACMAVIPLQDLMVLGTEARMNFPGKVGGFWAWRFTPEMLSDWIGARLRELTELYGRELDLSQTPSPPTEVMVS